MSNLAYSVDNEFFHNDLNFVCENYFIVPGVYNIYVGEKDPCPPKHSQFIDIDNIIEAMQDSACDEYGELAECYLSDIFITEKNFLKHAISRSFNRIKKLKPNFFRVVNSWQSEVKYSLVDGIKKFELINNYPSSKLCKIYNVQNCHNCYNINCGDNENKISG